MDRKFKEEQDMKLFKRLRENEKGFTLVELIIVIAILAILAILVAPRIMDNLKDAKKSRALADAKTIANEITTANALQLVEDGTLAYKEGELTSTSYEADAIDDDRMRKVIDEAKELKIKIIINKDGSAEVIEPSRETEAVPDDE